MSAYLTRDDEILLADWYRDMKLIRIRRTWSAYKDLSPEIRVYYSYETPIMWWNDVTRTVWYNSDYYASGASPTTARHTSGICKGLGIVLDAKELRAASRGDTSFVDALEVAQCVRLRKYGDLELCYREIDSFKKRSGFFYRMGRFIRREGEWVEIPKWTPEWYGGVWREVEIRGGLSHDCA